MSSSTHKRVMIRRRNREVIRGWVNPHLFESAAGIEMMTMDGQVTVLPYDDLTAVHFVRDFDEGAQIDRAMFHSRPKLEGLWIRLRFRDSDEVLEGVLANNLLAANGHGFTITPPDPYSNTQKIFVPRSALAELTVLGVIGSAATPSKKRKHTPPPSDRQIRLFQ